MAQLWDDVNEERAARSAAEQTVHHRVSVIDITIQRTMSKAAAKREHGEAAVLSRVEAAASPPAVRERGTETASTTSHRAASTAQQPWVIWPKD
jgi:hypothetical protein